MLRVAGKNTCTKMRKVGGRDLEAGRFCSKVLILRHRVPCYKRKPVVLAPESHHARSAPGLRTATAFLHKEYLPEAYWWELMEMLRRFILVGVLVVVEPGSITQSKPGPQS